MTSPGKAKIDWLQREPGTERQPKGIFCSVFQCKADGGNGDPTGRWKLKVLAVVFPIEGDMTEDFILENLKELCTLTGYTLVCHPPTWPMLAPSSPPQSALLDVLLSPTDLYLEEQHIIHEKEYHTSLQKAYEIEQLELRYLQAESSMPLLSILTVLWHFKAMGGTREELVKDLSRLLLDRAYWIDWCVKSEWLIDCEPVPIWLDSEH